MLESIISTEQLPIFDGIQIKVHLKNGLGISAVSHKGSLGSAQNLWEIAVFVKSQMLHLKTITGDDSVTGHLTFPEVLDVIQRVSEL
jgi:hypothetical protein